jgi:hypothetical protein
MSIEGNSHMFIHLNKVASLLPISLIRLSTLNAMKGRARRDMLEQSGLASASKNNGKYGGENGTW